MKYIYVFLLSFCMLSAFGQGFTVSGTVTDDTGELLPGASVIIRGTVVGTSTDAQGRFTLSNVTSDAVLQVSFVGLETQNITVGDRRLFEIKMVADGLALDEVVVVGYGTLQRRQVTSSISSLSGDDLPQGVGGSSIANALQGRVAGLIMSGTENPNSGNTFQLRGMASINTSREPLIVIDGMPGGDIRSVTPEEIQSIDVLKDASAGAIYGTRATGGVILITTKQAQAGKARVSYTGELHLKQAFGAPDLLKASDYVATYGAAKHNYGYDTDWWQEALRDNATSHRHVFSVTGGTEAARIFASLTYDNNKGVWRGSGREDYSGRINTNFTTLDGWLYITARVNYRQALRGQNLPSIEGVMRANPTQTPYDSQSITGWNIWTYGDDTEMNNIGEAALNHDQGLDKWFRPDISLRLNILPIPGLTYQHTIAYENRQWERHRFRSMNTRSEIRSGRLGWARLDFSKTELLNTDGFLSYDKVFDAHRVNAVAGYSYFERNGEEFHAENSNFTNDRVQMWNIGEGTRLSEGQAGMGSGKNITQRLLAQFARVNYSYNDTYMATASIRREGSSKFAEQNRWGIFWALSAGWRMSNESFLENVSWLNDLTLRFGYGVTGNEGFPADYAARMYGSDTRWLLPTGRWAMSYGLRRNVNPTLGWEEKKEWNVGVDFSVFSNRLYGKFDLYRRAIDGLIFNVDVPQPPNTESQMYRNIGTMDNFGWEIELGARVVRNANWNYNTSLNMFHNKTTVGSLWGDASRITGREINNWVQWSHQLEEGITIGSYHLLRYAGVDESGFFQVYNRDGDVILADQANRLDRVYTKANFIPQVIVGWSHDVSYKNWSLSATFTSWINHTIYNGIEIQYGLRSAAQGNMTYDAIKKNNHIVGRPAPVDYFLYDGTFLKVQNLTLAYTIPLKNYTNLIERVRLYFTGDNLLTLTSYPGLNPQVNVTGWEQGVERASDIYPQTRTFAFGIQMNF